MSQINIILIILFVLGLLSKNNALVISSLILFGLRNLKLDQWLSIIEQYSVKVGIMLIMLGILTPVATGELDLLQIKETVQTPLGILGIGMGILVTIFTRDGLVLMDTTPEVVPNLVVGIILGIAFFGGVPSGPIIASGITAFLIKIFRVLS
ncbi:DUF441 domain-containing protein [Sporohalobacter salinus]|uniref:DUF441 domain-containing protein n=1 Tax=Sporohalobacter salinus TaxID=1494606 RepID=UPI0019606484|nr:DUF441 domain-containing protein [Sporohalobacter salinus]MBM7622872.1 uncharacterized membrane protein (DUF441 family) [Sporohalobacter salinus]